MKTIAEILSDILEDKEANMRALQMTSDEFLTLEESEALEALQEEVEALTEALQVYLKLGT